jgi:hypothetical protein
MDHRVVGCFVECRLVLVVTPFVCRTYVVTEPVSLRYPTVQSVAARTCTSPPEVVVVVVVVVVVCVGPYGTNVGSLVLQVGFAYHYSHHHRCCCSGEDDS